MGKDTSNKQEHVSVPVMTDLARQYYQTGNIVWVTGVVFRLMIPAAILWTGLSTRIYDMSHKLARTGWYFTILFYHTHHTVLVRLDNYYVENWTH